MSTRYRSNYRTAARPARWMELRYTGACKVCRRAIPAGETAFYDPARRTVTCTAMECAEADGLTREEWHGSPVSGRYVKVLAEHRIGGGHQTWKQRYGRCEDAPCCGCCD